MPSRANLERWLRVLDLTSYYEILGVPRHASDAAIRDAFHQFGAAFHPDRHRDADDETRREISQVFRRGVEAYRVLRDPTLRARYDLDLSQGRLRLEVGGREPTSDDHSLRALCVTPAGRLYAGRADQHLERGDFLTALGALEQASDAEGENPALAERLAALRHLTTSRSS